MSGKRDRQKQDGSADSPAPPRGSKPESWFQELTAALGWNPMIGVDVGPTLESCRRTADSWAAANRIALGAALAVAECQFRVLCQVMEEGLEANAKLLRATAPAVTVPDQAWRAVRRFEHLLESMGELSAIVAKSQVEIADTMNRRMAEMAEEVQQQVLRLKQ